ncbi:MAG: undecaprenyl-phosphate glucose phosphotransferase [Methylococcales bacterium]|jgi:Undecaprenyl-phosphate glucose phosphotransferase|nr:undecaprenyl-phosphate glucose phosphotransferase [Methylococcales bacterium]
MNENSFKFKQNVLFQYSHALGYFVRLIDIVLVFISAGLSYKFLYHTNYLITAQLAETPETQYFIAAIVGSLVIAFTFPIFRIYRAWRGSSLLDEIAIITMALLVSYIMMLLIVMLMDTNVLFSRVWFLGWFIINWLLIIIVHSGFRFILRWMRYKGANLKNIVIVGAGNLGESIANNLQESLWTGLKIQAFFDDNDSLKNQNFHGIEVVGCVNDVHAYVNTHNIDQVWIALPLRAEKKVKELLLNLKDSSVDLRMVPDIFGLHLLNHSITEVAGMPVLNLSTTPMIGIHRVIKAVEDIVFSLIILFLISPIMLLIAILIKFESPKDPVFFKQKRYGMRGDEICVLKFRTMTVADNDSRYIKQATKNDDRITRLGAFLRKSSLDEIPQFFNVLRGTMSIVGPRPHAVAHNEMYRNLISGYMQRHIVRPGITGWAQVNGWRGETDTLDKMKNRVEYDLYYIENWSLWFDIKIILITVVKGFFNKNAY